MRRWCQANRLGQAGRRAQQVVLALSAGAVWSVHLASAHPERVLGVVAIGAVVPSRRGGHVESRSLSMGSRVDTRQGWAKYNRYCWLEGGYPDFVRFFLVRC